MPGFLGGGGLEEAGVKPRIPDVPTFLQQKESGKTGSPPTVWPPPQNAQ